MSKQLAGTAETASRYVAKNGKDKALKLIKAKIAGSMTDYELEYWTQIQKEVKG